MWEMIIKVDKEDLRKILGRLPWEEVDNNVNE